MAKNKFYFSPPDHEYPLTPGEVANFQIKPRGLVCEWMEENLTLVKPAYMYPGKFKAWAWQREPINAFNFWGREVLVGAVQMFKSGITDGQAFYTMSVLGLNIMLAYANEKKSADSFDFRYVPMIKSAENPALRSQWSGKDDDLSKGQLKLNSCICKIASANNENDMASFSAPVTFGSEVGKWKIKEGRFNPVILLRGRSDGAFAMGDVRKSVLESSPFEQGDLLYQEVFREGTCILTPFYPCPHCGTYQVLSDHQIKVMHDDMKHHAARIRELKELSVRYECAHCGNDITEAERGPMSERVVWAMPEIEEEGFKQRGETIAPDGSIKGRLEGGVRLGYDTVCYWWNRLSDVAFPFYECLARFFESINDDEKKKSYENETMARWWKKKTGRIEEKYLNTRRIEYYQWGDRHYIPDTVLGITLGVDTQDDGFYYSFVGWGKWLSWLIVRQGFVPCPRVEKGYEYQTFEKFINNLYAEPLRWYDGSFADIIIGGMDRGGHRADEVDYIVKHFPGNKLFAYIGLTQKYPDRPMIYKSEHGDFWLGQTDPLSQDVGAYMAGDNFHLPMDVDGEFVRQIGRQFHQKKIDINGKVKVEFVHNYLGADHGRDTLNINLAAAKVKDLDKILLNAQYCETLTQHRVRVSPERYRPQVAPQRKEAAAATPVSSRRGGSYFNTSGGRGR